MDPNLSPSPPAPLPKGEGGKRRWKQEPRFYAHEDDARRDTLNYFSLPAARVLVTRGRRCDACENEARVTDGYMVICVECGRLLELECKLLDKAAEIL